VGFSNENRCIKEIRDTAQCKSPYLPLYERGEMKGGFKRAVSRQLSAVSYIL